MRMSELYAERSTEQMLEDEVCSLRRRLNETATLRDEFAMAALPFFIGKTSNDDDYNNAAVLAYKYADAMLREREWKPEED